MLKVLISLLSGFTVTSILAIHDGRLCCRFRDQSFKPTGIAYIEPLDSIFAVSREGFSQLINFTDTTCGVEGSGESARATPKYDDKPWGDLMFEGATTKGDRHVAYVLEGGRADVGPAKIHFFDLDSWTIFHTVPLPEVPVNDEQGAGALTWIPDGHADGRFLVGSHIDGTIYAYRVSSDTSDTTAKLIKSFQLDNIGNKPPYQGKTDLSGMSYDFAYGKLWTLFHDDSWSFYVHNVEANGEVANYLDEQAALAFRPGGSPPYKHEGIAIANPWGSSRRDIWIADRHRFIYQIRYKINNDGFMKCPWVGRRVIGCCFKDQPCQNMATDDCWAAGGFYVGKTCAADTCADTAFGSLQTGCSNSSYFETINGDCPLCSDIGEGGIAGCEYCDLANQNPGEQLSCKGKSLCLTRYICHCRHYKI